MPSIVVLPSLLYWCEGAEQVLFCSFEIPFEASWGKVLFGIVINGVGEFVGLEVTCVPYVVLDLRCFSVNGLNVPFKCLFLNEVVSGLDSETDLPVSVEDVACLVSLLPESSKVRKVLSRCSISIYIFGCCIERPITMGISGPGFAFEKFFLVTLLIEVDNCVGIIVWESCFE